MSADCLTIDGFRRALHNLKHLLDLIAQFPRVNPSATEPSDLDIPKLFRQIRSRYKVLCATLGAKPTMGGPAPSQDAADNIGEIQTGDASSSSKNTVWRIDNASQPPALSF